MKLTFDNLKKRQERISVVGLGYVGLPLAIAFAEKFKVTGFDNNSKRIEELKNNYDRTGELNDEEIKRVGKNLTFTDNPSGIDDTRLIIVTVPTPIDSHKIPDLGPLKKASEIVGQHLQKGSVVVYESTVYPGVTRNVCVPIIEKSSHLKWLKDFYIGYSPERINPGDKEHTVKKILKVVSADRRETLDLLSKVYGEIIEAGIHKVSSIEVAEAAKVIENTQRDLNVALINELAIIFHRLGIDTKEVLEAAGTKWNFLRFSPGLVGGHCIGVDPYYLTFRSEEIGYHPEVILSGRRINDFMGKYIAEEIIKLLIKAGYTVKGAKLAILGVTFKEDVPDIRNSRVFDIIDELKSFGVELYLFDPMVSKGDFEKRTGWKLAARSELKDLCGVVVAVAHNCFRKLDDKFFDNIFKKDSEKKIIVDVKGIFERDRFGDDYLYWRL